MRNRWKERERDRKRTNKKKIKTEIQRKISDRQIIRIIWKQRKRNKEQ